MGELYKTFNKVRGYLREMYVNGFKSREEYVERSARTYDDERNRIESLFTGYYANRFTSGRAKGSVRIDSRLIPHNPLYRAWKAKSFTEGDITFHFFILDILAAAPNGLTVNEIIDEYESRLEPAHDAENQRPGAFSPARSRGEETRMADGDADIRSRIEKKLREYAAEGILRREKQRKIVRYFLSPSIDIDPYADILDFFSEVSPCGVIGSYLLDKFEDPQSYFKFKHHYLVGAMDSEIMFGLLEAISEKKTVTLEIARSVTDKKHKTEVVPLRILVSAQSGRQYLFGYELSTQNFLPFRFDHLVSVKKETEAEAFDSLKCALQEMEEHTWGVGIPREANTSMEHVEFTITYRDDERYIPQRLEREKRSGTVEQIDANTCRFSADVYDTEEMLPWIYTFLCRITDIQFSNPNVLAKYRDDLAAMYRVYDIAETAETEVKTTGKTEVKKATAKPKTAGKTGIE